MAGQSEQGGERLGVPGGGDTAAGAGDLGEDPGDLAGTERSAGPGDFHGDRSGTGDLRRDQTADDEKP